MTDQHTDGTTGLDTAHNNGGERDERLRREAVAWLSLLSSGAATQADAAALKRWCREDPAHANAYAKAARAWRMLKPVAEAATRPDPATLSEATLSRRAWLGGAAAAAAACAAYGVVHPPLGLWPSLAELNADVRTGVGEQRRVEVAKGVVVDLNTRSSLVMGSRAGDGRIELISGEAVIAAAPNESASCVVIAGAGQITARDARFDVRHDDNGRVRVASLDGHVHVEHQTRAAATLTTGQQIVYDRDAIGAAEPVDPVSVSAWQQGRLVFRRTPLADVVAEVNRYRPGLIMLVNSELGARLIDASFQLSRLENVIVYVQEVFDARVRRLPGAVVIIS